MSAVGVAFGKLVGAAGGPQLATILVVGGLVVGAGAGGFVASQPAGGTSGAPADGELAIYPCPDQGPALATVGSGQQMLVTGRTADNAWLRIHFPAPGRTEGWVQAAALTLDGSEASLPVAECAPVAEAPTAPAPSSTLTAIVNATPTPAPTPPPTATPSPSPTPNGAPTLSGLTASTKTISYDTGSYCPTAVKKVTLKVTAKDDAGIASVTLFWRVPGASSFAQKPMTQVSGSATSGTWQTTLDTKADGITKAGSLAYYAVATDVGGATRRLPSSGSSTISVAVCANTGPAITSAKSSSGSSLYWDPLGVGSCATSTTISAAVSDQDGVASVTLFYRRPGDGTYSSKPMTLRGSTWVASINTVTDKLTIPSPPTASLPWYIKAVDGKGAASQTKSATITVRRCDSEANWDGVFPTASTYACTTAATITIATYAGDQDQPGDGLSVTFYWSLTNPRTGAGPIYGKMKATVEKGNYYQGTTTAFNGKTFYAGTLVVYAITTDQYGGTTRSTTQTYTGMACQ